AGLIGALSSRRSQSAVDRIGSCRWYDAIPYLDTLCSFGVTKPPTQKVRGPALEASLCRALTILTTSQPRRADDANRHGTLPVCPVGAAICTVGRFLSGIGFREDLGKPGSGGSALRRCVFYPAGDRRARMAEQSDDHLRSR